MRALVLHGPDDLRLEHREVPEPEPGEVVVRVEAATTCATDAKILRSGDHPALGPLPSPFGHEAAGTVVAVGRGVDTVTEGARVVPANSAPCGSCRSCSGGGSGQCENLIFLWGAFAEFLRVPRRIVERNLVPLPDGLDIRLAPLAEPLACAVRAADHCEPAPSARVVILGGGAQGALLTALLAKRGCQVTVCDPHQERRERALEFGASDVAERVADAGDVREIHERCGEPDIVIEAVGRPEAWQAAVELVRPGGQVLFYGGCTPGSTVALPTSRLHYDELTLRGSFHHDPRAFRTAVGLLSDPRAPYGRLLESPVALDEVGRALRQSGAKRPVII
ncbi:MAG: alcohol dehydrogenase catalytic domain-containing protein [Thermoleophilia bacterium]|nr:alcohol dehydrogenase catalytic domain-containing protein [Thermoleophilia bacterium]MDH3725370.1 alcohol dehydrogenase catalytic domain-containing protein [Thermoleophilia bacterium]